MKRRALITGATGLIGSRLTAALLNSGKYEITISLRPTSDMSTLSRMVGQQIHILSRVELDLENFEDVVHTVSEFDVIFNCAANVNLTGGVGEELVASNVNITYNLSQAVLASTRKPLLLHVSSIAALGSTQPPDMVTEETMFADIATSSPYTRSKFLSENEVWRAAALGAKVVVVNPSVVVGSTCRSKEGLQPIIRMAASGRHGLRFSTCGTTGFVSAEDVADAMVLLAENPGCYGKRYIISAENLNYNQFATLLNQHYGKPAPSLRISAGVLKRATGVLSSLCRMIGVTSPLSPQMADTLSSATLYDGTLITRCVEFTYRSITRGLWI